MGEQKKVNENTWFRPHSHEKGRFVTQGVIGKKMGSFNIAGTERTALNWRGKTLKGRDERKNLNRVNSSITGTKTRKSRKGKGVKKKKVNSKLGA